MKNKMIGALAVLSVLTCVVFSTGVSLARYVNSTTVSAVYAPPPEADTLASTARVYDFGCWNLGDADDCDAVIRLTGAVPLKGTLRFTWDAVTTNAKDIAVVADGFNASNGAYAINEADGRLDFPFSLLISGTTRVGVATLDVTWTPDGKTEPTLSACYLVALNPSAASGSLGGAAAQFVHDDTGFVTGDLLYAVLDVPGTYAGAMIAPGLNLNKTFSVGTQYFTDAYPQGVTLLRASALYLPADDHQARALIDVGDHTNGTVAVNFAVGVSQTQYSVTSQTPTADSAPVTVSHGTGDPIISTETKSLVFTLKEAAALCDTAWNQEPTANKALTWSVERLVSGKWTTVTTNEHIAVTAKQTATGGTITVSAPKGTAPAGTYRLVTAQTYLGYDVYHTTTYFFVDYR